jgi:hypothetical protein
VNSHLEVAGGVCHASQQGEVGSGKRRAGIRLGEKRKSR